MKEQFKRIYFITGKGGVGKTTLAAALATYIRFRGNNVVYVSLEEIETELTDYLTDNSINHFHFDRFSSAEKYISKRLKSELISSLIMKAPLFKTIFNIVPGFGQLIILGNIVEMAINNPSLSIIVDSPSSGHMITMLESISTFKQVFGSGLLVKDIHKIEEFISNKDFVKTIVSSLPTVLAMNEGDELATSLPFISNQQIVTVINNSLTQTDINNEMNMPLFLKQKLELESKLLKKYVENNKRILPHIPAIKSSEIINKLWPLTDILT